jgi:protein TonB
MAIKTKTIVSLPASTVVALVVTCLLFIAIPLLTKISTMQKSRKRVQHVMISQRKPPPPPEPEQEEKLQEQKKQEAPKKAQQRQRMPQPKLNVPTSGLSAGMGGTIAISGLLKQDFEVSDSLFVSAFNLNEVDQPPRLIRAVNPRYPFEAAQKGIEGRVTLRFVVDSTGMAQEPEVVASEPEGVFDEAALAVVKKYKFKPAMKGGKPVDCIVKAPIKFSLSE